jgi:hypothetical protein
MGSPILLSSDLQIIDENRCSREWVNKTERPKFVPMKKVRVFKITFNREMSTKLIQKNSFP